MFGGVVGSARAFSSPGIRAMLERNVNVRAEVAKVVAMSALRIQNDAKRMAPVKSGRLRQSLTAVKIDNDGLTYQVGTGVVATKPLYKPRGKKRKSVNALMAQLKARKSASGSWHFMMAHGYSYPARQEFEETWKHTTGEWGYMRKSLHKEAPGFRRRCSKALLSVTQGKPGGA